MIQALTNGSYYLDVNELIARAVGNLIAFYELPAFGFPENVKVVGSRTREAVFYYATRGPG